MTLLIQVNLTFLQNYTVLLFSLAGTSVCQLVISQNIWQQAVNGKKQIVNLV